MIFKTDQRSCQENIDASSWLSGFGNSFVGGSHSHRNPSPAPPLPSSPQSRGCPVQPVDLCASIRDVHLAALSPGVTCAQQRRLPTSPRLNPSTSAAQFDLFCRALASRPPTLPRTSTPKRPYRVRKAKPALRDDKARSTLCRELEDAAGRAHRVVVLMLGRRGGCYWRRAPFPAGKAVTMEKLNCPQLEGLRLFKSSAGGH